MTERVGADRDDRQVGANRHQPLGVGRGAAVMRDLEDAGLQARELLLRRHLDVTREEHRPRRATHHEHDGLVVGRLVATPGTDHLDLQGTQIPHLPRGRRAHGDSRVGGRLQEVVGILRRMRFEVGPQVPHRPLFHHRDQPGDMVGVNVSGDHQLQVADTV